MILFVGKKVSVKIELPPDLTLVNLLLRKRCVLKLFRFVLLFVLCVSASAQMKFEGMGNANFPVSTKNAEAQAYFNQGLNLCYGFNHDEAGRSFQKAAELDPNLAMAWWGLAFTLGSNYNMPSFPDREKMAAEAMEKALALAPKASKIEQGYINALSRRYSKDEKADRKALAQDYANAMRMLHKQYPDDLNLATLFAESMMNLRPWQLWNVDGTPAPGTEEIVATIESVLKRDPNHPGANHYYIHAVEASKTPHRALPSAHRLPSLAPGAGHLVHMPSHIYMRTGDHDAAAKVNVDAAKADEAYIKKSGAQGIYPMMYYSHNIHFEAYAHAMQGRYADAIRAANKLREHASPHVAMMPMLQGFTTIPTDVLVRFEKWDDVLKLAQPKDDIPFERAHYHFARGMALAAKNLIPDAKRELEAVKTWQEKVPADFTLMQNTGRKVLDIARNVLGARIAQAAKDNTQAETMLKTAAEIQQNLVYIEPPEWFAPVKESLGYFYLATGNAEKAEATFREDLDYNPRNGRSLYGLMKALNAQKKTEAEAQVRQQFEKVWTQADTQLAMASGK